MSIDQDVRSGLAAELDALPPGVELVAALERLSPAALTGEDLAAYLRGCARAQSRGAARALDAMHHLGRAQAQGCERLAAVDEFSGDEVAAVLGWSRTMSSRKLDLAEDLADRLPAVGEALWEGWLDEPKATRFCEWTRDLADDLARHVCQVVLPEAPELPVGELIRRIEQTAAALDPEWAARRARRAEKNARVILSPNPTGTATFSVCDLAAPTGLAMRDRVDGLAAAVRGLGVLTPVGTLRAEVAARLLDESTAGLADRDVALLLAAEYHRQATDLGDGGSGGPGDGGPDDGPDEGPSDGDPTDGNPTDGDPTDGNPTDGNPTDGGPDGSGPDDGGPDGSGPNDRGPDEGPSDGDPTDGNPDDSTGPGDPPDTPDLGQGLLDLPDLPDLPPMIEGPDPRSGRVRSGTTELRLRLTTALGLDEHPAAVPGYGTVLAPHARTLLQRHHGGEWRIVLTDDDGRLQRVLLARRRPRPPHRDTGPRPRGESCTAIVELQVPATVLAALTPDDHRTRTGDWASLLTELHQRLGAGRDGPPAPGPDDHIRRRPRAETDRWVRVRDRHCIVPACRRPAHRADLDHTVDHAHGGPSVPGNLGVVDHHHHRAKHHAHWRIRQPTPGHFTICTRAGVHHTTRPKRILEPLPAPRPAAGPRPLPADGPHAGPDADDVIWRQTFLKRTARPAPSAGPTTTPGRSTSDDPPPF
ncbi:HNH endonuclease signature motif containing protein [Actinomycetospora chibensis]|uniref:DUF222 domain-containing protein n=1 Tax=Actinomycetospora chibensis TaxID=663606 RepID=A0ABV9RJ76_9PSEU|nr:DUF222 domain-containing protein [Actinomycetospora chibensis]MDD7925828.1 DUF222 domain-containing protein [Actinomycetospora chibensis]